MGKSKLDEQVLVLNAGWQAVHFKSVSEAITDVYAGCATIMDVRDKATYCWDDWAFLDVPLGADTIQTCRGPVWLPSIIVLTKYNEARHRDIKMNRRNIFLRDRYECQYCGKAITMSTGSLDHVHPKSRGGGNTWDNLTTACKPCNTKKRNITAREAGLPPLRSVPQKPRWHPLSTKMGPNAKPEWAEFFPDKSRLPEFFQSVA